MNSIIKNSLCIFIIFSLGLVSACSNKPAFTDIELNSIDKNSNVIIRAKTCGTSIIQPKAFNNKTTLSKVISWLKEAKQYDGKVPADGGYADTPNTTVKLGTAIGLYILTSDNSFSKGLELVYDSSTKQFIPDVLSYTTAAIYATKTPQKVCYIKSKELYNYIINDEWKAEFG